MTRPVVATGQQIGAGWSPALSVVKALAALLEARRIGGEAVHWLADEDHDRAEVASVAAFRDGRWHRHRFRFEAPRGTAAGWLPWIGNQQAEAEALWGRLPLPEQSTLRGHALALGGPLWALGIRPFSPTDPAVREPIQGVLASWRGLDLEADLRRQAERLEHEGAPLPLDPRTQAAWFSLDPRTGLRQRLDAGAALPSGHWLSPGAALRPLMQSLLLPVDAVVLGPSERAYWRLCEPLWERVGLRAPRILPRPTVFVLPKGIRLTAEALEALRQGNWEALGAWSGPLASERLSGVVDPAWPGALKHRFDQELARARTRLGRLDRRLHRQAAADRIGEDPEALRQRLFPFGRPQERVLAGALWLRRPDLLEAILTTMSQGGPTILLEEP